MIDTHAHIYLEQFEEDLEAVLSRAQQVGIKKILMPNIDVDSVSSMMTLSEEYAHCYPMVGLHPCSVKEDFQDQLDQLHPLAKNPEVVAVGEIGLDYHWDLAHVEAQKDAFNQQCEWAIELGLPIAVHCRKAYADVIDLLSPHCQKGLQGVLHCFSGTLDEGRALVDMGFHLGIGGVITFKNGGLDKIANQFPLDRLVLETDAPYLAPTPFRGKRNEPSYVQYVAQRLSEVLEIPMKDVIEITSENALKLFHRAVL